MDTSYDDALRFADESVRSHGYDARRVSKPVQVVYLVGQLDFEVTIGGVVQWLTNRSGRYAAETVTALDEIGARDCAAMLREVLAYFPGDIPHSDDVARAAQVQVLRPTAEAAWRELGDRLLEWPDDVDTLLRKYVELHAAHFLPA